MKLSSVVAGLSAAVVAFQGVAYAAQGEASLLRPPGAQGEKDFSARCVKCGKCIEACPYLALFPAPGDQGFATGTPMVDARSQACRLCEDFPCVDACPTGALRDVEQRLDVRMGTAVIDEDLCIAFQGMRCEVCYSSTRPSPSTTACERATPSIPCSPPSSTRNGAPDAACASSAASSTSRTWPSASKRTPNAPEAAPDGFDAINPFEETVG